MHLILVINAELIISSFGSSGKMVYFSIIKRRVGSVTSFEKYDLEFGMAAGSSIEGYTECSVVWQLAVILREKKMTHEYIAFL